MVRWTEGADLVVTTPARSRGFMVWVTPHASKGVTRQHASPKQGATGNAEFMAAHPGQFLRVARRVFEAPAAFTVRPRPAADRLPGSGRGLRAFHGAARRGASVIGPLSVNRRAHAP